MFIWSVMDPEWLLLFFLFVHKNCWEGPPSPHARSTLNMIWYYLAKISTIVYISEAVPEHSKFLSLLAWTSKDRGIDQSPIWCITLTKKNSSSAFLYSHMKTRSYHSHHVWSWNWRCRCAGGAWKLPLEIWLQNWAVWRHDCMRILYEHDTC